MSLNFCAIFKIGQKCHKKLPKATNTFKLPMIVQNFYILVKKLPKNFLLFCLKIAHKLFRFVESTQKSSQKAPKFWRDLNLATSLLERFLVI
jgi:hypothetical protein